MHELCQFVNCVRDVGSSEGQILESTNNLTKLGCISG